MTSLQRNLWLVLLFCLAGVGIPSAQVFTTLVYFNQTNGAVPVAALTQGLDGNLYSTTLEGGVAESGTFFVITPGGQLTTLYSFCSQRNCADGQYPYSVLVQDQDGNFWGTTKGGLPYGFGTIFKVTTAGVLTTVLSFNGADGEQPQAGLTLGSDGNFYGTTSAGGLNNGGTVFNITPTGTLTTLHNFNFSDGNYPVAGLLQAIDGDFYGTTLFSGQNGGGTVFRVTASGSFTTLYNFCSKPECTDGEAPRGTLIQVSDGNLYGTTSSGGVVSGCNNANCGTMFEITPAGTLTTLYSFCSRPNCSDGGQPLAGIVQGTNGLLYGGAAYGGANNDGTVFKISSAGKLSVLHAFDGADGWSPDGGLMQDTNGRFYGTSYDTVFSLSTGLHPFVKTSPSFGKVGASVIILGTNLSSTKSVSFNGTAATFSVLSDSEIQATVPTGATTGVVKVITTARNLKSNTTFRVTQ